MASCRLGKLQREYRYPSTALHQNSISRFHFGLHHQRTPRCGRGTRQCSRFFKRIVLGHMREGRGTHSDHLSSKTIYIIAGNATNLCQAICWTVWPMRKKATHHPVANLKISHTCTHSLNHAGTVRHRYSAIIYWQQPTGHHIIMKIERASVITHPNFHALQLCVFYFYQLQIIQPTWRLQFHCAHYPVLSRFFHTTQPIS